MKLKSLRGNAAFAVMVAVIGTTIETGAALNAGRNKPHIQTGDGLMAETSGNNFSPQSSKPNPDLKSLERLVGTWKVTGEAQGTIRYEWAEGGFFLIQHFDLIHNQRRHKGIEIIGHLHPLFADPSKDIRTRVYNFLDGLTLDYVYELAGDTLTIWGGEKGSSAYYKGAFSKDGNTLTGSWVYPGGGYKTITTRVP
jgi:hypothetical protein